MIDERTHEQDDVAPEAWRLGAGDERLAFLRGLGFEGVQHDSHVPFLSHLIGTARTLRSWGARPALCDAGLFHSVYGTEYFPLEADLPREDVIAVIGPEAERVAWLWCTVRRDTFDAEARTVVDRHSGEVIVLSEQDLADVAELWAADTVEQIDRMTPEERAFAAGLPLALDAASPAARDAVAALA
jgi:hypothetical protein